MFQRRSLLILAMLASLLAACGGGGAATPDAESSAEGVASGQVPGPVAEIATVSSKEVGGKAYVGPLNPPQDGAVGMYLDTEGKFTAVMTATGDAINRFSAVLTGEQAGQRFSAQGEGGFPRIYGRFEGGGFNLNITVFGGNALARVEPLNGLPGGIYTGELNGLPAGLVLLPDGSFYGFATVEGGDAPSYEELCLPDDLDLSSPPDELAASTCEAGDEVTLARLTQ